MRRLAVPGRTTAALVSLSLLSGAAWADAQVSPSWHVAASPDIHIGSRDGDPRYLLEEVTGTLRLSDGRIIIADGQAQQLRVYDSTGRHLDDWGRDGEGPGEFRYLRAAFPYRGDSVAAYDARGRRITMFAADGRVGRSVRLTLPVRPSSGRFPASSYPELGGVFANGSFLVVFPEMIPISGSGAVWSSVTFAILSAVGEQLATIGPVRGSQYWIDREAPGRPIRTRLGPRFSYAVHADGFIHGNGESASIEVRDTSGRLLRTLRVGAPRTPVTDDMRRSIEADARDRMTSAPEGMSPEALRRSITDALPAFGTLLMDSEGAIWVEQISPPSARTAELAFTVFDLAGHFRSSVGPIVAMNVKWIDRRLILGAARDDLHVAYVLGYRLAR